MIAAFAIGIIFLAALAFGLCKSASTGDEILRENEIKDGSTQLPILPVERIIQ